MFSIVFLLALLAFSVTGLSVEVRNSTITLPMIRGLAFSNVTDLLQHDKAHLVAFGEYSINTMLSYTVRVAICNPLTDYNFSSVNTNVPVAVNYQFGTFQGTIWEDGINFSERVSIFRMHIGAYIVRPWCPTKFMRPNDPDCH
ncbi:hypothetical protein BDR04DRAFT_1106694 [Suillus decipiens]|nr:hypothetical protein BDR04DRAFT_1106694 [Suillus decipiens]